MANEVKLKLAVEGGQLVSAEIDGVNTRLDKLNKISTKDSVKNINDLGVSAGQTAMALRSLPAQFTDIAVSLQGGMSPFTVLMQQGGQIKDMFGGIGPAAKAMGGYIVGLINPFTVTAAAAAGLAFAYTKGAAEAEAFNRAMILTGNASGATALQLSNMAQSIHKTSGSTVGAAAEAVAAFTASGRVAAGQIEKFASVAVAMGRETGVAVADTVKQFEDLGKEPVTASLKLNETTHFLTLSVYQQVKSLQEQGKASEAAALAQSAYSDAMKDRMPKLTENLGLVEKAWRGVAGAAKWAWDETLNIGRGSDPVAELQKRIALLEKDVGNRKRYLGYDFQFDTLKNLREQLAYNQHIAASNKDLAASQKANSDAITSQAALDKDHDKYLSKAVQKQLELNAAYEIYKTVKEKTEGKISDEKVAENQAKYDAIVKGIKDKYKDSAAPKASTTISEATKGLALHNELMAKASGLNANFAEESYRIQAAEKAGLITKEQMAADMGMLIKQQPYMIANEKAWADQAKESMKAVEALNKEYEKEVATFEKSAQSQADKVAKYQTEAQARVIEADALVLSEQLHVSLAQAIEMVEVARLKEMQTAQYAAGNQEAGDAIKSEIASREKLIGLIGSSEAQKANDEAAKKAASAWESTNKSIGDGLYAAIAEGGDSAIKKLLKDAKEWFARLVLNPIISPIAAFGASLLNPTAAAAQGTTGGALGTTGGALGELGFAANMGSLYDKLTGGFDIAGKMTTGFEKMAGYFQEAGASTLETASTNVANSFAKYSTQINAVTDALAGYALYKGISGDKSVNPTLDKVGAVASLFGPVYGIVGGLVNQAFGSGPLEMTGQGIRGNFAGTGFSGTGYANYKREGGWLSGDTNTTDYSAVDATTQKQWSAAFAEVKKSATDMATSLGLSSDKIANYSKTVDIAAGTTGEQMQKMFADMYEAMLLKQSPKIAEYSKVGETVGATAQRMSSSLDVANKWLRQFNQTLYATSLEGAAAASRLADVFGGFDKMDAAQSAYYSAMTTDGQKFQNLYSDISKAMRLLGLQIPGTVEQFNKLRDGLDKNLPTYESTYAALTLLGPQFKQVNDYIMQEARKAGESYAAQYQAIADEKAETIKAQVEEAKALAETNKGIQDQINIINGTATERSIALRDATDATTVAMLNQLYAQQDLKTAADAAAELAATNKSIQDQIDIATGEQTASSIALRDATNMTTAVLQAQLDAQTLLNEAVSKAADEAKSYKEALSSAGSGIAAFIRELKGAANPDASLSQTRDTYNTDLTLAKSGDVEASNRIASSARAYLDAQEAVATSEYQIRFATARMASQLSDLPATKSYEQKMLEAIDATTLAVNNLNGKLVTELTVTARSEITKTIKVIGESDLSPEQMKVALLTTDTISRTIGLIAGSDTLTAEQKRISLLSIDSITRTYGILAGSDTLTDEQRRVSLLVIDSIARTYGIVAGSDTLTDEQRRVSLLATDSIARTYGILAGDNTLTDEQKRVSLLTIDSITRTYGILAGDNTLTAEQKRVSLLTIDSIARTYGILAGSDTLTDEQRRVSLLVIDSIARTYGIVAGSDTLTDEQRRVSLLATDSIARTYGILAGDNTLTAEQKRVSLLSIDSITRTYGILAGDNTLTDEQKRVSLLSIDSITRTYGILAGDNTLTDEQKRVSLLVIDSITRTYGILAGDNTLTYEQKRASLWATDSITRTYGILAGDNTLTDEQKRVSLLTIDSIARTYGILAGDNTMTDEQKRVSLLTIDSITRTYGILAGDNTLTAEQKRVSLLTIDSIARTYGILAGSNTLTDEQKRVSLLATDSIARTYGILAGDNTLTAEQKRVSLLAIDSITRTYGILAGDNTLTYEQKRASLWATDSITRTYGILAGSNTLTDEQKRVSLLTIDSIARTYGILAGSNTLTDEQKRVSLLATDSIARTYGILAGDNTLTAEQKRVSLLATDEVSRTLNLIAGTNNIDAKVADLALLGTATISRNLSLVAGWDLESEVYKKVIADTTGFNRTIDLALASTVSAEMQALAIGQAATAYKRTLELSGMTKEQIALLNEDVTKKVVSLTVVESGSAAEATAAAAANATGITMLDTFNIKNANAKTANTAVIDTKSLINTYTLSIPNLQTTFNTEKAAYDLDSNRSNYARFVEIEKAYLKAKADLLTAHTSKYFYEQRLVGEQSTLTTAEISLSTAATDLATQRQIVKDLGGTPSFAVGTNQVPFDMQANIHKDERIIPAADNRELMQRLRSPQQNNEALVAEIRALRKEVEGLRYEARATATNTGQTAKLIGRAMPDGDALATRVAE